MSGAWYLDLSEQKNAATIWILVGQTMHDVHSQVLSIKIN